MTRTLFGLPADADAAETGRRFRAHWAEFVAAELAPNLAEWNTAGRIPRSAFAAIAATGVTGIMVPREAGGAGGSMALSRILVEELLRYPMAGVMTSVLAQTHTVLPLLAGLGDEARRAEHLIPSLDGRLLSGIAITDPAGGSDLVRAIGAHAVRAEGGWVVNGEKMFITNGPIADYLIVLARTDARRGALGMTLFVVDTDTPGFTVVETLDKLGLRASPTGLLRFDDLFVPDSAVLGAVGDGFRRATDMLSNERLLISVCAVTMAEQCLARAAVGGDDREFAADVAELAVVRSLVEDLIERRDRGIRCDHEIAAAKFLSAELVQRVTRRCVIRAGGTAVDDYLTESYYDSRVLGIFAGSSETMREYYASRLTLGRGMGARDSAA